MNQTTGDPPPGRSVDHDTQRARAQTFRERHLDQADGPLVLPNSWDVASTLIYESMGFDAVGTSSAGLAATWGVPDGEHIDRREMMNVVERIAGSVRIPVSADIEAGYGDTPESVAETVQATIDAGAVGMNLEDGIDEGDGPLVDTERHCDKLRAARQVAEDADVPLVINGRTDVFWRAVGDDEDRTERAVERANAYYEAGSDCLFVPGVSDPDVIGTLVDELDGPLNVLGGPGAPTLPELAELGVARVSVGSGPMRATLGHLRRIGEELREEGTYHRMEDAIPYGELNELLVASSGGQTG